MHYMQLQEGRGDDNGWRSVGVRSASKE